MKKAFRVLAYCYIAYLLLVLLVITPALNLLPAWAVEKYAGRTLSAELVTFNPFTLSLDLRKTEIPELDGSPFFTLEAARVDLSVESIWSRALVFDEVSVQQLYLHILELRDGNFNFSDMLPTRDEQASPEAATGIPAVTIHSFNFDAQQLVFSSESRAKSFTTGLSEVSIQARDLSTVLEEGKPYSLQAKGMQGGTLHWEGLISIPRGSSEGTLTLNEIRLMPLWKFVEPWVVFELADGTLSVAGKYKVDWSEGLRYWINQGELSVNNIAVRPMDSEALPDTALALGKLQLTGIDVDGPRQRVAVDSLTVAELAIQGWSEGKQVSLAELFAFSTPASGSQQAANPGDSDDTGGSEWAATLGKFELVDSRLNWRTEFTDPGLLEITPISASAQSIQWPLAGETDLALNLTINGDTSVSVDGSLDLAQGAGTLSYKLAGLPLPWFNPNLPSALKVAVTDGLLAVNGEISLAQYAPVTIAMDGAITKFAGKMAHEELSLTSWETVRWKQLVVDMEAHRIDLARLSINDYSGRIHINKDGSINAQNIWKEEVGAQAEEVAENLTEGKPWTIALPLVRITDSEIDFMDESLPISFRTVIGDINGDIKNISTKADAKTTVSIKGSVDGYAPVALKGSAQPLREPPAIDLGLTFKGVDMALLSPYSGTYAGYAIERGVLNLDLAYVMEEGLLKGNNKIVIDQMKLGPKVPSEKAADIPLKLALALLTDSRGVIDMEIPVSGNVDDPQFSVGSVVMGALLNLITKAVTSPFTLLAGLVDSEADLQHLKFKTGSSKLLASTTAKLNDLATALAERPELGLVITGRLQLEGDRERLQKYKLQDELIAEGLSETAWSSKSPEWDSAIEARYQAFSPGENELTIGEQYLALARNIPLPDEDLLALANSRAVAIKTYLVNEAGLNPERAAISKPDLNAKSNRYSGAELEIDI